MFWFLFCVFCVCILFCILFLPMYMVVYFPFVYSFPYHCHRVGTRLPLIQNHIISYHNICQCCLHILVLVRSLPGLSLTSRRNLENALANSSRTLSPLSNMAAKLPLTIFGDIGELASRRLDPKLEFRCRVSV